MYEVAINFFSKAVTNMYAIMCPQAIVSIQRSKELSNEREKEREGQRERERERVREIEGEGKKD